MGNLSRDIDKHRTARLDAERETQDPGNARTIRSLRRKGRYGTTDDVGVVLLMKLYWDSLPGFISQAISDSSG